MAITPDDGVNRAANSLSDASANTTGPSLADRSQKARDEMATWTPEQRANTRLEGSDFFAVAGSHIAYKPLSERLIELAERPYPVPMADAVVEFHKQVRAALREAAEVIELLTL